jgi:hypothetical protein
MSLKDSGQRQEFETGAVRDSEQNKGMPSLLPMRALIELSKLFEEGCKKYGANNWAKGIPADRYIDSMIRHMAGFMTGQTDEAHLVQMTWNAICLLDTVLRIKESKLPQSLLKNLDFNQIKLMNDLFKIDTSEITTTCQPENIRRYTTKLPDGILIKNSTVTTDSWDWSSKPKEQINNQE